MSLPGRRRRREVSMDEFVGESIDTVTDFAREGANRVHGSLGTESSDELNQNRHFTVHRQMYC